MEIKHLITKWWIDQRQNKEYQSFPITEWKESTIKIWDSLTRVIWGEFIIISIKKLEREQISEISMKLKDLENQEKNESKHNWWQ